MSKQEFNTKLVMPGANVANGAVACKHWAANTKIAHENKACALREKP